MLIWVLLKYKVPLEYENIRYCRRIDDVWKDVILQHSTIFTYEGIMMMRLIYSNAIIDRCTYVWCRWDGWVGVVARAPTSRGPIGGLDPSRWAAAALNRAREDLLESVQPSQARLDILKNSLLFPESVWKRWIGELDLVPRSFALQSPLPDATGNRDYFERFWSPSLGSAGGGTQQSCCPSSSPC